MKSCYYNEYWSKYLYSNNKYIISHYNWKDIDCNLLQGTHWNTWKLFNHMLYGHFFALPRVIDYKMYTQVTNWRKSLEDEGKNNECRSSYTYYLYPITSILMGDVSSRLIMLQFTEHSVSQNDLLSMKILSIWFNGFYKPHFQWSWVNCKTKIKT